MNGHCSLCGRWSSSLSGLDRWCPACDLAAALAVPPHPANVVVQVALTVAVVAFLVGLLAAVVFATPT